jgi:6-phosphogluconolactonase/glucosamine-6-phosphate isomerase/deaminase
LIFLIKWKGNDGHIASLFPPVGKDAYSDDIVVNTQTETMAVRERMSVTMKVIKESSKQAIFLKGKEKGKVYDEMINSKEQDVSRWPLLEVLKDQKLYVVAGGWE